MAEKWGITQQVIQDAKAKGIEVVEALEPLTEHTTVSFESNPETGTFIKTALSEKPAKLILQGSTIQHGNNLHDIAVLIGQAITSVNTTRVSFHCQVKDGVVTATYGPLPEKEEAMEFAANQFPPLNAEEINAEVVKQAKEQGITVVPARQWSTICTTIEFKDNMFPEIDPSELPPRYLTLSKRPPPTFVRILRDMSAKEMAANIVSGLAMMKATTFAFKCEVDKDGHVTGSYAPIYEEAAKKTEVVSEKEEVKAVVE